MMNRWMAFQQMAFDSVTYLVSLLGGHFMGLLESGLLPNIITGSSARGFVAAFVCTHTDKELLETMQPKVLPKFHSC
jgi:hypothetical protein